MHCRYRFFAAHQTFRPRSHHAIFMLIILVMLIVIGFLIGSENNYTLSPSLSDALIRRAQKYPRAILQSVTQDPLPHAPKNSDEHEDEFIGSDAKQAVIKAISLHRGGQSGKYIIKNVLDPDSQLYRKMDDLLKKTGVSPQVIREFLNDWDAGVRIQTIKETARQRGIDISRLIQEAERSGIPVEQLLRDKDTGR